MHASLVSFVLIVSTLAAAPALAQDGRPVVESPARPSPSAEAPFEGASLSVGARLGSVAGDGELPLGRSGGGLGVANWAATGTSVAAHVGVRFSPAWTLLASYEYADLEADFHGRARFASHGPGVALRATTNRRGRLGFVAEMGAGYRFLAIDRDGVRSVGSGFEPLRAAVGLSVVTLPRLRLEVLAGLAVGQITTFDMGNRGCANIDPELCTRIAADNREWHAMRTLSVGGTFDL